MHKHTHKQTNISVFELLIFLSNVFCISMLQMQPCNDSNVIVGINFSYTPLHL